MATRLSQVLTFTAIPPTVVAALQHSINVNGVQVAPDFVLRDNGDFTILSCTDTTLTVRNDGAAIATLNAWLERQHTIERVYGAAQTTDLAPQPFIPAAGGGGGGAPQAVIFDDAVPADRVNIRSDRASNQSPIDNTNVQITNLGSQDGAFNPGATGATGRASTIGGGDDNTAAGDYATVAGGGGNTINLGAGNLNGTIGGGANNGIVNGDNATIGGGAGNNVGTLGTAQGAVIGGGEDNVVAVNRCVTIAGGSTNTAQSDFATIGGGRNNALQGGDSTIAGGDGNTIAPVADSATISGGKFNTIDGACHQATIGGGRDNHISAGDSVIPGGRDNLVGVGAGVSAIGGGQFNQTLGFWSTVPGGLAAQARLVGQQAFALGDFTGAFPPTPGQAQTSVMVLRGTTPGGAINQTVELMLGADGAGVGYAGLVLEDGKSYIFKVWTVASGIQGVARHSRAFETAFNVQRNAGLTTLNSIGANVSYGDAGAATWTMAVTIGVAPDRVVLTFNTGAGATTAAKVVAKVEFTEAAY